jgi:ankyrin repeat protein
VAEFFIQRGADVNKLNQDGETPLSLASGHGRLEIAHLLLRSGSNVDTKDRNGSTPLHKAAQNGHLDIMTLLLDSGADVSPWNSLDVECANQRLDVEWFLKFERLLVERRGGLDSLNRINRTLPDTSSLDPSPDAEESSNAHGEDTDNPDGFSLLRAAFDGNLEIVRSLLDGDADVDYRDKFHRTALHAACIKGTSKLRNYCSSARRT